jgi:drug/metabolite transporter (DMT)-like permease
MPLARNRATTLSDVRYRQTKQPPLPLFRNPFLARWTAMSVSARGIFLVSAGSLTLVAMALIIKQLGSRFPAVEILFFRSAVGFLFVLPFFWRNPLEPLRTKRHGAHLIRGVVGTLGNLCFFWTVAHMLLADAVALQFSRPLFMLPLAVLFLGEVAGLRRSLIVAVGFLGILIYARPFTAGFDPGALVGAAGAVFSCWVVICIKWLAKTEPTRVIMFYYSFWTAVFSLIPALYWWVTPTPFELVMLVAVGVLGIYGQGLVTHGYTLAEAGVLVTLDYSRVIYAAILGYLLFGEIPGPWNFVGMALIIAASLYLVLSERGPVKVMPAANP